MSNVGEGEGEGECEFNSSEEVDIIYGIMAIYNIEKIISIMKIIKYIISKSPVYCNEYMFNSFTDHMSVSIQYDCNGDDDDDDDETINKSQNYLLSFSLLLETILDRFKSNTSSNQSNNDDILELRSIFIILIIYDPIVKAFVFSNNKYLKRLGTFSPTLFNIIDNNNAVYTSFIRFCHHKISLYFRGQSLLKDIGTSVTRYWLDFMDKKS